MYTNHGTLFLALMKMKFSVVARWLSGLCLLIPKMVESDEPEIVCYDVMHPILGIKGSECLINDTVPADLGIDKNIQGLGLLNHDIKRRRTLVAQGPLNYPNLIAFSVITSVFTVPRDYFSLLHKLDDLELIITNFTEDKVPDLPPSITVLSIIGYKGKSYDLSKLSKLEKLQYSNSSLFAFPNLPNTAPIKTLDFSYSPLTNLTLPDIAQYCRLKDVNLNGTALSPPPPNDKKELYIDRLYCEFQVWFESHNISYKLSLVFYRTISPSVQLLKYYDAKLCAGTVLQNPDAEAKYKECLNRTEKKPIKKDKSDSGTNIIVGVVIALVFILLIIDLVYISRRRNEEE